MKDESVFGSGPSDDEVRSLIAIADRLPPLREDKADFIDINANARRIFTEHAGRQLAWELADSEGYSSPCTHDGSGLTAWNLGVKRALEPYPRETYLRAAPAVTTYLESCGFHVIGNGSIRGDEPDGEPYLLKSDYQDDNGATYGITSVLSDKLGPVVNTVGKSACMHDR